MSGELGQWLHLVVRWFHVVAGVMWIGQTALFTWLDTRMRVEVDDEGRERVWMVHSGGFYLVEKQTRPELVPRTLHWFRWEAAASWASGVWLLVQVYWLGGLMVDSSSPLGVGAASAVGGAVLVAGWLVYDSLWISPLERGQPAVATAISLALLLAIAWGLSELMSGRAAYLHVGAVMGTVMAANVWMRILPAQRQTVEALEAGTEPDPAPAARAKLRSGHNTFMALPVIFIMISSHFPVQSYGHRLNWLMLGLFVGGGFVARAFMNRWNRR